MKKIHNFSRQIKVVNSYLAYNRNIFTNFVDASNVFQKLDFLKDKTWLLVMAIIV